VRHTRLSLALLAAACTTTVSGDAGLIDGGSGDTGHSLEDAATDARDTSIDARPSDAPVRPDAAVPFPAIDASLWSPFDGLDPQCLSIAPDPSAVVPSITWLSCGAGCEELDLQLSTGAPTRWNLASRTGWYDGVSGFIAIFAYPDYVMVSEPRVFERFVLFVRDDGHIELAARGLAPEGVPAAQYPPCISLPAAVGGGRAALNVGEGNDADGPNDAIIYAGELGALTTSLRRVATITYEERSTSFVQGLSVGEDVIAAWLSSQRVMGIQWDGSHAFADPAPPDTRTLAREVEVVGGDILSSVGLGGRPATVQIARGGAPSTSLLSDPVVDMGGYGTDGDELVWIQAYDTEDGGMSFARAELWRSTFATEPGGLVPELVLPTTPPGLARADRPGEVLPFAHFEVGNGYVAYVGDAALGLYIVRLADGHVANLPPDGDLHPHVALYITPTAVVSAWTTGRFASSSHIRRHQLGDLFP
jgi:hypothetical protein